MDSTTPEAEGEYEFEKVTTLKIDESNPGILSVRPSESLEIVRCVGKGRLLASVSEASSNRVVVEDAVCFDSDAYVFDGEEAVDINHTVVKDATACALVELHVEQSEALVVEIKQTFRFSQDERRRFPP